MKFEKVQGLREPGADYAVNFSTDRTTATLAIGAVLVSVGVGAAGVPTGIQAETSTAISPISVAVRIFIDSLLFQ